MCQVVLGVCQYWFEIVDQFVFVLGVGVEVCQVGVDGEFQVLVEVGFEVQLVEFGQVFLVVFVQGIFSDQVECYCYWFVMLVGEDYMDCFWYVFGQQVEEFVVQVGIVVVYQVGVGVVEIDEILFQFG